MLIINRTDMLIVAGNTLGFFTGSGNVIPFSVDLSDFLGVSGKKVLPQSKSTQVTMFSLSMKCTTSSKETVFLTFKQQFDIRSSSGRKNRMNCKLCRIIRRESGFIVVVHRFLQREKLLKFYKG